MRAALGQSTWRPGSISETHGRDQLERFERIALQQPVRRARHLQRRPPARIDCRDLLDPLHGALHADQVLGVAVRVQLDRRGRSRQAHLAAVLQREQLRAPLALARLRAVALHHAMRHADAPGVRAVARLLLELRGPRRRRREAVPRRHQRLLVQVGEVDDLVVARVEPASIRLLDAFEQHEHAARSRRRSARSGPRSRSPGSAGRVRARARAVRAARSTAALRPRSGPSSSRRRSRRSRTARAKSGIAWAGGSTSSGAAVVARLRAREGRRSAARRAGARDRARHSRAARSRARAARAAAARTA